MRFLSKKHWLGGRDALRAAVLIMSIGLADSCLAADSRESELKAVFLLNFLRYVEWPSSTFSSSNAAVVIGVLGDDPFDGALERTVARESVGGRAVVVRHLDNEAGARKCQLVFISASAKSRMAEVNRKLAGLPVLTVSDAEGFLEAGGMIGLYTSAEKKIRIIIQMDPVNSASLIVSSKLLRLAEVRGRHGKPHDGGEWRKLPEVEFFLAG